ncbi:MAG: zf-TFIIB domain-containing protein [Phenylobacterium sp.]
MPLHHCPSGNTAAPAAPAMSRSGVELDMCTSCRGVWMNPGELKKALGAVEAESEGQGKVRQSLEREADSFRRDPQEWVWSHHEDKGPR